ncbi:MAG TPA: glycosyltransferase family 2 protein [Candidatus Saccharimonadales bacterium]|jgi:dolichol-phosphate mannosyltransferase
MNAISIVVPTLNEADNVPLLVARIATSFKYSDVPYEIIFVDDHSTDGTVEVIKRLQASYPVSLYTKQGSRGKAYSLLEGFSYADNPTICMIDADLQYPPEAILPMFKLLSKSGADVILTERVDDVSASKLRHYLTKGFNLAFTRLLFGFKYDSQSGLKLFRRSVINRIDLDPTPWSFDLEFIVRSLEISSKVISYRIPFSKRYSGQPKVRLVKVAYELAVASVRLRMNSSPHKIRHASRMNSDFVERTVGTSGAAL